MIFHGIFQLAICELPEGSGRHAANNLSFEVMQRPSQWRKSTFTELLHISWGNPLIYSIWYYMYANAQVH